MASVRDMRRHIERLGRGFALGFSATVGVWVALVLLAILATLVLRPWH